MEEVDGPAAGPEGPGAPARGGGTGDGGRRRRRVGGGNTSQVGYSKPVLPPLRLNGMEGHDGKVRETRRRRRNKKGADSIPSRTERQVEGNDVEAEGVKEQSIGRASRESLGVGSELEESMNGVRDKKEEVAGNSVRDQGKDKGMEGGHGRGIDGSGNKHDEVGSNDAGDHQSGEGASLFPPRPAPARYRAASSSPEKGKVAHGAAVAVLPSQVEGKDHGAGDERNDNMSMDQADGERKRVASQGADEEAGSGDTGEGEAEAEAVGGADKKRVTRPFSSTLWDGNVTIAARHGVMCRRASIGCIIFIVVIIIVSVRQSQQ